MHLPATDTHILGSSVYISGVIYLDLANLKRIFMLTVTDASN